MHKNFTFAGALIFAGFWLLVMPGGILAQESSSSISITVDVPGPPAPPPPPPPSGGGGGGGYPTIPEPGYADLTIKGLAYPASVVTVLRNGAVIGTVVAALSGRFEKTMRVESGIATFSLFARDAAGLQSPAVSFSMNIITNANITAEDILLPPTLRLNATMVLRGEVVAASGSAAPGSVVSLVTDIPGDAPKTTIAEADGLWRIEIPTGSLPAGEHTVRARSLFPAGEISAFSHPAVFTLTDRVASPTPTGVPPYPRPGDCRGADLTFDGRINIADVSILMFYWQKAHPANPCADINRDGFVGLGDFSLMMWEWTD